jgi:hypothetical protein
MSSRPLYSVAISKLLIMHYELLIVLMRMPLVWSFLCPFCVFSVSKLLVEMETLSDKHSVNKLVPQLL